MNIHLIIFFIVSTLLVCGAFLLTVADLRCVLKLEKRNHTSIEQPPRRPRDGDLWRDTDGITRQYSASLDRWFIIIPTR